MIMGTFNEVLYEIKNCRRCIEARPVYKEIINTVNKPCIEFDVFGKWMPEKVKLLFIAESPPRRDPYYFYNDKTMGDLKRELFKLLNIHEGDAFSGLRKFRENGFFLMDTVKCRCDKRGRSSIPQIIVQTCSRNFLGREIDELKPQKICVLGKTALAGLGEVDSFGKLKGYKIRDDCGRQLNLFDYNLTLCLFPSTQNKRYYERIKRVFKSLLK